MKMETLFYIAGTFAFALFISNTIALKNDATDGKKRSGMVLRIDHGTGCHYLESIMGGITPRLDTDGKQICTGPDNLD